MSLELKINFSNGKVATCSSFFVCGSYRPLQAYWPGERAHKAVFKAARDEAIKLFGERAPITIVPPVIDTKDPERPFLPDCRFTGSFHRPASDTAIVGISVATIIWFQPDPFPLVDAGVAKEFEALDWSDLSLDIASDDLI